ncbi:MAG: Lrp/AsnC family transcriptional regulator [Chloroflexi bacterium]|nr:Lrp/AsnC family transcriptional regulator [Chloroflexota bacterium]
MEEILKILENDARTTPEQIATMTGKSVQEVTQAIHQAEHDRTIVKYKTVVNWEKMGREEVWAVIEVRLQPQREFGFDAVAERIYRFPEVRSAYLVSGTYDLAVFVTGKTMHEVAGFVSRKLSTLESVQGTVTHFLLKRYKEDGEILDGDEKPKREPFTM